MKEKQLNLKEIAKKIDINVKEFAETVNDSTQALNSLKTSNPLKYKISTLGIVAKRLGLNYDDLVLMKQIKDSVKNNSVS